MAGYLTAQTHPWLFERLFQRGQDQTLQALQLGVRVAEARQAQEYRERILAAKEQERMRQAEGFAALSGELATTEDFDDPDAEARFWAVGTKHPTLVPQMERIWQSTFGNAKKARMQRELLGQRQEGQLTLEQQKAQDRQQLLMEKFNRLSLLQEDSQEHKELLTEIKHEFDLERDAKRPRSTESDRMDLDKSDEISYRNELAALKSALDQGMLRVKGKPADSAVAVYNQRRQELEDKYKARSRSNRPATQVLPAASAKRIRVKAPDGTIGNIPEDQLDEAKRSGYTIME